MDSLNSNSSAGRNPPPPPIDPRRLSTGPRRLPTDPLQELAARQHGVVTRRQLLALGISGAAVGRRVQSGLLRTLHRGVYLLGPLELEWAMDMAAVLAMGPDALLSHASALRAWELLEIEGEREVHVTVPGGGRRGRTGIVVHRSHSRTSEERAEVRRIPVTAPCRTIADAAGFLGSKELERVVAAAERAGIVTRREMMGLKERYPRRAGMTTLRSLLEDSVGPQLTRSEAERRCLTLLRKSGLPRPHVNVPVGPYELDLFWPTAGVAIEIDGYGYHASRTRFEGDRRKDAWLRARGIHVIRLTWRQITRDPLVTAVQVGQALALASSAPPPAPVPGPPPAPVPGPPPACAPRPASAPALAPAPGPARAPAVPDRHG